MTGVDFAVLGRESVSSRDELATLLRDTRAQAVRLCGSGSSFDRLPPPRQPVCLVSLAALNRIERLDAADLTCSVEPGVTRAQLDAELARHKVALPCPGDGTIGGLLARGEHQPLAPGASAARNIVLGLEGVLTDGTKFKTGARVVKSVAGFDVHRAFVGSRGRLFAATLLHLKLRPAPAARLVFAQRLDASEPAFAQFRMLRLLPATPSELFLQRERNGTFVVTGVIEGAREHVDAQQRTLRLALADREPRLTVVHDDGEEVLEGVVQPSALPRLLATLPGTAPFVATGTGQFQVALSPPRVDEILNLVATLPGGCAEIRRGTAARRGKCTPLDDGAARLERDLRAALDRRGLLQ